MREKFMSHEFLQSFCLEYGKIQKHVSEGKEATDEMLRYVNHTRENVADLYEEFKIGHYVDLDKKFNKKHNKDDKLIVQGLKVRGVYKREKDARARAQYLRKSVERAFDIFVAPVGKWVPFNPISLGDVKVEYMNDKLNKLVKSKLDEDEQREVAHHDRKVKMMERARKREDAKKKMASIAENPEVVDDEDMTEEKYPTEAVVEEPVEEEETPSPKKTSSPKKSKKPKKARKVNNRRVRRKRS